MSQLRWRSPKTLDKICSSFVLIPYIIFSLFFSKSGTKNKTWFNAAPWTYCVLFLFLSSFVSLSFSLPFHFPLSLLIPEPFAKQNYLYRECKCRATECLCKACERSGTASSVTSSRPTQNNSKCNTGTASIPSGDCLPDGWYCQCFRTRNSSSRSDFFCTGHHGNDATTQTG